MFGVRRLMISGVSSIQGRCFYKTVAGGINSTTTDKCIDLRSDTVTRPTAAMREAMKKAVVGDDVYGEDPTVKQLEKRCAALFGKDAGLFVASGTMGNLIAIMAHCQRGDEIILGRDNHIHRWEHANYAQLAGVSATTLEVKKDGSVDLEDIESSIRNSDLYMPQTKLLCLETTHNFSGGKPMSLDYLRAVRKLADQHSLKVHIDGARIYNAAVHLNVEIEEIAKHADTLMMCFSKGLGAPIGSILVGPNDFIEEANRRRKALGGGWRQAGIMASAASLALDSAVVTTKKDHDMASTLANGINQLTPKHLREKLFVNQEDITNMVILHCRNGVTSEQVAEFFQSRNILVFIFDDSRVRMIPNCNLNPADIDTTLTVYKDFVDSL